MLYNSRMKNQKASWIRSWVQPTAWVIVAGVLLYLALRNVDLSKIWQNLSHTNGWFLSLALLCVAINTGCKAARWQVLFVRSAFR